MPPSVASRVYQAHRGFYDGLQQKVRDAAGRAVPEPDAVVALPTSRRRAALAGGAQAAVVLISGCQDNQFSMDGPDNGAFTGELLGTWNNGRFKGDYRRFHSRIRAGLPSSQSPNLFTFGTGVAAFLRQSPFTV